MKKIVIIFTVLLLVLGCTNTTPDSDFKPNKDVTGRASLMYIIGDNDLHGYLLDDVLEFEFYFPTDASSKFFIFHDYRIGGESYARLYEVKGNSNSRVLSPILKDYGEVNACDTTVFNQVMLDIKYFYPNISLKNITLSSHGKGWVPYGSQMVAPQDPSYSFGVDYSGNHDEMDIHEMAICFEKYDFDVIVFDACHMASIEVFYELKDSAKQIIASPAEISGYGFPYKDLASHYSTGTLDPEFITSEYYKFYNSNDPGGTITYVNTDKLEPLADMVKELLEKYNYKTKYPELVPQLTTYSRFFSNYFDDFYLIFKLLNLSDSDMTMFDKLWKECFPVYHKTEKFDNFNLKNTYGVSFYPPNPKKSAQNEYFKTLDWAKASGLGDILK